MYPLALLPWLLVVVPAWASPQTGRRTAGPLAPDGRRGLGSETRLQGLRDLVQSRAKEDEAFISGLLGLRGELSALASTAQVLYHRRGYFDALDWRDEPDLESLLRFAAGLYRDPEPVLARRDERARVAARVLLDVRARIRFEVLDGWEADAAAVERGVLVLRGESDGWVRLEQEEASNLAARVDLAAASLRARILDLRALREDLAGPSEVDEGEVENLLAVFEFPPGPERARRLALVQHQVEESAARMRSLLFLTHLRADAEELFRWREGEDQKAEEARQAVRVLRPDAGEGAEPPELAKQSKTSRRRAALHTALEGLIHDPLDPELAYAAGTMAEFVLGRLETLSLYDRFLALRGIRPHDDRNWRGRKLTEEEDYALFYVQRYGGPGVPPPTPPAGG